MRFSSRMVSNDMARYVNKCYYILMCLLNCNVFVFNSLVDNLSYAHHLVVHCEARSISEVQCNLEHVTLHLGDS